MSEPLATDHDRPVHVLIVRIDGTVETVTHPVHLSELAALLGNVTLGAHTCVGRYVVREHGPVVMLVDDDGLAKGLPFNSLATALYGGSPIVGDAAITADELHLSLPADYVTAVLAAADRPHDALRAHAPLGGEC